MNYRFEYNGNPEYVTLHVTERLTEETYISHMSCCEPTTEADKELVSALSAVDGATETSFHPYSITAKVGVAFERDDVLAALLERLKMYFTIIHPEITEYRQLPTLRSDLRQHLCQECERIQREELAALNRDFDTLGY